MFYISNWPEELAHFESEFTRNFEVSEFNDVKWFLGWHIERDRKNGTCKISQQQFVLDALARFGLSEVHAKHQACPTGYAFEEVEESDVLSAAEQKLYMEKVGTLNYLCCSSRGDI